jgi:hypothetical protein
LFVLGLPASNRHSGSFGKRNLDFLYPNQLEVSIGYFILSPA